LRIKQNSIKDTTCPIGSNIAKFIVNLYLFSRAENSDESIKCSKAILMSEIFGLYSFSNFVSIRRPRHRWEDGIRMDLREIGWESVDWIQLAQDRDL
jgi:hypothetical protein